MALYLIDMLSACSGHLASAHTSRISFESVCTVSGIVASTNSISSDTRRPACECAANSASIPA